MPRSPIIDAPSADRPTAATDPRLFPPTLRSGVLPRPRLVDRLTDRGPARIVTVVAPAGYGKTTLLGAWRAAETRPVAWITLDLACADPAVVLDLIASAIDDALGTGIATTIGRGRTLSAMLASVVPRLAGEVRGLDRPLVILLDDLQEIDATPGSDALATFIGYLPASVTVGVAGRTTGGLPVARWRAGGLLRELDERDLALDADESLEMSRSVAPLVSEQVARDLRTATEGWPAALYLAFRSAADAPASADAAAASGGRVAGAPRLAIDDYLRNELVGRMDLATTEFLLETSILDRLTGPLCDAVTEESGSAERLADLATHHHLIVPLDDGGRWYRAHSLLRSHLLARLEQDGHDVASLHRRAAGWFEADGSVDAAIEHRLAAGDSLGAARLAGAVAMRIVREGRIATLHRWVGRMSGDALAEATELTAVAAISAILRGDERQAADLAAILESGSPRGTGSARPFGPTAIVEALMARDGLAAAFEVAQRTAGALPPDDEWRPSALAAAVGIAVVRDDLETADRLVPRAEALAAEQRAGRARASILAFGSIIAARRDAWPRADRYARDAVATVEATGQHDEAIAALSFAVAARSAAHRGDLDATRRHLTSLQGAAASLTATGPWLSVPALVEGARAYLAISDPAGARTLLRHAEAIAGTRHDLAELATPVSIIQSRIRNLAPGLAGASTLTPAEIRVLLLLPTYLSMPEIAERLIVSPNTVRTQVQSIYGKLGASSRAEAIDLAVEAGLLEPLPILAAT